MSATNSISTGTVETFLTRQLRNEHPLKRQKKIKAAYCAPISLSCIPVKHKKNANKQAKRLTSAEKKAYRGPFKKSDLCGLKYAQFSALHELHTSYLTNVLSPHYTNITNLQNELLKLDLHGAILKVERAKCSNLVGTQGIVIMETKFTFRVVTKKNKVLTLPKKSTVYAMEFAVENSRNDGEVSGLAEST